MAQSTVSEALRQRTMQTELLTMDSDVLIPAATENGHHQQECRTDSVEDSHRGRERADNHGRGRHSCRRRVSLLFPTFWRTPAALPLVTLSGFRTRMGYFWTEEGRETRIRQRS